MAVVGVYLWLTPKPIGVVWPNLSPPLPTAPGGQPWLAMQYVRGQPITRYADERRLSVTARLGLFVKVCDAAS